MAEYELAPDSQLQLKQKQRERAAKDADTILECLLHLGPELETGYWKYTSTQQRVAVQLAALEASIARLDKEIEELERATSTASEVQDPEREQDCVLPDNILE